jgi:hypothetical protein
MTFVKAVRFGQIFISVPIDFDGIFGKNGILAKSFKFLLIAHGCWRVGISVATKSDWHLVLSDHPCENWILVFWQCETVV